MEHASTVAILTLALLTAPALAGGVTGSSDEPSSTWLPEDKLMATGPGANLGADVALEGDTAVVGTPGSQRVVVYQRDDVGWTRVAELTPERGDADGFGSAVAIDEAGSAIVVGAPSASEVHVFEFGAATWSPAGVFSDSDASCLGLSVAIHDGSFVAGAPCEADEVHVLERGSDGWGSADVITGAGSSFGSSVALEGSSLAASDLGVSVQLFAMTEGSWQHQATVSSAAPQTFGRSIDLEKGVLAVGDPTAYPTLAGTGSVHVFERDGDTWSASAELVPTDASPFERQSQVAFGTSVAVEGERLVVGAPGDDRLLGSTTEADEDRRDPVCWEVPLEPTCQYAGAAYVFDRTSVGWEQTAKLTAPDAPPTEPPRTAIWGAHTDAFGGDVDLSDEAVAVGAPFADRAFGDDAGAAYVFEPLTVEVG